MNNISGYNLNTPAFRNAQAVQIPDIYRMPDPTYEPISAVDTFKKADAMGFVTPWLEHPILTALTTLGVMKGFDLLAGKMSGKYEESLLGRAANFGDKIHNSDFFQNETSQKVLKPIGKAWDSTKKYLHKNKITSAILDTPAVPEWDMAKSELCKMDVRILQDFKSYASDLGLGREGVMSIKNLDLNKANTEAAKKYFNVKKLSEVAEDKLCNFVRLKQIGVNESQITNILAQEDASKLVESEILKKMKLSSKQLQEILKDETGKTIPTLEKALANIKNLRIRCGHIGWLGPIQPLERGVGADFFFNRFHSISSAKTATGRACAKAMQTLHRMATFGGGKIGVLMFIVPHFVNTILNTIKADKNEKVGTLTNGILMSGMWVVTFPLAAKILYGLGGLQNIGTSKANVDKMNEIISNFSKQTFNSKTEMETARKAAKEAIKKLRATDGDLLTKMLRKVGSFLDIGNGLKGATFGQKIGKFGKNCVGVPLRFIAVLGISGFVLDKAIEKVCASIFGKPYNADNEKEHEEAKKQQKIFLKQDLQNRLVEAQQAKIAQPEVQEVVQQPIPEAEIEQPAPELPQETQISQLQPVVDKKQDTYTYIPSQETQLLQPQPKVEEKRDNYNYIPSSDSTLSQPKDINKYIPSQLGANISKSFDNSGLNDALRRADKAEQRAVQILSGKF